MSDFLRSINNFLKSVSKSNAKVMALCILGATTFWFFNALNKTDYEAIVNYPVEFTYNSDSTVIVKEPTNTISLQLNGGGWELLRTTLGINKDPVLIPIQNPTEQKYILTSSVEDIISDEFSNLTILSILTDTISFDIQYFTEKKVFLDIDSTTVQFKPLFYYNDSIMFSTRYIKYSGPKSMIDSLPDTLNIVLKNESPLDGDYQEIITTPFITEYVSGSPEEINISIGVKKANQIQKMVPLKMVNFPDNIRPEKEKISVTYYFLKNRSGLDSSDIVVELNYDSIKSDSTIRPNVIDYPAIMKVLSYDSSSIQLVYDE
ncbi:YbbR-like domain-containing protein [Marinigracilibium pacificum]|uniref:YbbR-like protein n=1 Tax=Marinigracilibium pacificum TaxID=2729599 RepID=A0A848IY05_9BACT|nr:hypothetical protein [Marinigracilibium pacificum]NMM46859.1 hypothetical protein [Marinigracilibium pacificum]